MRKGASDFREKLLLLLLWKTITSSRACIPGSLFMSIRLHRNAVPLLVFRSLNACLRKPVLRFYDSKVAKNKKLLVIVLTILCMYVCIEILFVFCSQAMQSEEGFKALFCALLSLRWKKRNVSIRISKHFVLWLDTFGFTYWHP